MTMMNEGENEDEDNYDDGKQKNDDEEENYEYFGQKIAMAGRQWQPSGASNQWAVPGELRNLLKCNLRNFFAKIKTKYSQ